MEKEGDHTASILYTVGSMFPAEWFIPPVRTEEERKIVASIMEKLLSPKATKEEAIFYYTYLKSPEWEVKRQDIFDRCNGTCEICRRARAVLVHHTTYESLGEELLEDLLGLCKNCHTSLHREERLAAYDNALKESGVQAVSATDDRRNREILGYKYRNSELEPR